MDTLIGDKGAKRAGTSRRQKSSRGRGKKPRADDSPFKRNHDAATKQINFRLIRLTSSSGVRRSKICHYRRRPFRAQFRECSFILDVTEGDGEASLCWDQSAASTSSSAPKQVTFCWTPVDVPLGAAAHCKAPDHLGTKNSINYLEIRMDVFLFQRTPLHLFVSLLFFQLQGHPGGVQEPNSSFSFRAHREVNTIFLACCNCRRKLFFFVLFFCMRRR